MSKALVMSYNIYYQDVAPRIEPITQLILRLSPDVLGLQELSFSWVQPIRDFMAEHPYSGYGYGRLGATLFDEEVHDREAFSYLLWKTEKFELMDSGHFWASSTPDIPFSGEWSDGVVSTSPRCINWAKLKDRQTGEEMVFLNCHLDYSSDAVRTRSAELMVEQMKRFSDTGVPVLMMGDFNFKLESDGYSVITQSGFKDVRFAAKQTTDMHTYNDWGKKTDNLVSIDHFFVTPNVTAESFEVVDGRIDGKYISDHYPILTKISF